MIRRNYKLYKPYFWLIRDSHYSVHQTIAEADSAGRVMTWALTGHWPLEPEDLRRYRIIPHDDPEVLTNKDDMFHRCRRCGEAAHLHNAWEWQWPLQGKIEFQYGGQIYGKLCRSPSVSGSVASSPEVENHPAIVPSDMPYQKVKLEWGSHSENPDYRLCIECHKDLIGLVGEFFGFPKDDSQHHDSREVLERQLAEAKSEHEEWKRQTDPNFSHKREIVAKNIEIEQLRRAVEARRS